MHDVNEDHRVQSALRELSAVVQWLNSKYSGIQLPANARRPLLALGCLDVALEHQMAIELLARGGLYGSMLALVRSLLEAFIRGIWLARCASDVEIDTFHQRDRIEKTFETLICEVEQAIGNERGTLQDLKKQSWGAMNSFTHTGMMQITRRYAEGLTTPNYSAHDLVKALNLSTTLGLIAAIEMATLAGHEALALETLQRSKEFVGTANAANVSLRSPLGDRR